MTLTERLTRAFLEEYPDEAALELERLPVDQRSSVVALAAALSADAVGRMTAGAAADSLARLAAEDAAPILEKLPMHSALTLLRRLPSEVTDRLMSALPVDHREALQRALVYPDGTAGALMDPRICALPDDITIGDARVRLRRESRGLLHYIYIVDRSGTLVGVFDIPEMLQAGTREPIRAVMHQSVERLPAWTPATTVRTHPGWRAFHAMPVTDDAGRLIGAIRYQTIRRLEQDVDQSRGQRNTAQTVGALGELFHLGMAGLVEGVAAAAAPRHDGPRRGGEV
jgi:magnesium transporter